MKQNVQLHTRKFVPKKDHRKTRSVFKAVQASGSLGIAPVLGFIKSKVAKAAGIGAVGAKIWKSDDDDCESIPHQECQEVPVEKCHNVESCHLVPKEKCKKVSKDECQKVPKEHCKKVSREECHPVTKEECKQV